MGDFLRREGLVPDQVLCSTALRTRQTLEGLALGLDALPPDERRRCRVVAGPAEAITDGELDNGAHPQVGLMVAQDEDGTPLWRWHRNVSVRVYGAPAKAPSGSPRQTR
mgnify:CR=1 FL=1